MERSRFSWIPNAISLARLACLPVLLALAWSGQDRWFAWLLLPALASDVLDGWLARRLDAVSRLGSLLDSVADILLVLVMVYAIWPLHPGVAQEHGWIFLGVVAIWCVAHLASLLRYGRLASFHTRLVRAGIFAFSLFAVVLFWWGLQPQLLYFAAILCSLGAIEHFILLALLPQWTPDLTGGIPEALRLRKATGSDHTAN